MTWPTSRIREYLWYEIAAALEIPERTVASRLIAAKARLRQILDSEPRKGHGIDMSTLSEDSVPSE